ncbi:MAG: single-stranded DNA-binding protein [Mariprofundaceae bacterium]|nr:single-stranded DNA-binding protein [Mariprofundaceae bacterium]
MLNKVMLIGNLGADPDTRFTQDQTCICNIRIATTERWKDRATGQMQERTEWHRIDLWGRLGEIANQYLRKGSRVYIEGAIRTDKWTDQNGQDRYTTKVRANEMKMLDRRSDGDFSQQQAGTQQAGTQQAGRQQDAGLPAYGGAAPSANHQPTAPAQAKNKPHPPEQPQNKQSPQSSDPFADTPNFANVPTDDDMPF